MKINFIYDEDKDIDCLLLKGGGSINSPAKPTKTYEALVASTDINDREKVREFVKSFRSTAIKENISKLQDNWNGISLEFERRAEKVFGIKIEDTITSYLTITGRFPYNIEDKYFYVSAQKTNANATCMHELWHFFTWYKFGKYQETIGSVNYNEIKEALTVLLNLECEDLMGGEADKGYPQHQELREKITELWNKEKNIEIVWNYCLDTLMKKDTIPNIDNLKTVIQQKLSKKITQLVLKGKGDCNYAYYVETEDGGKYIVKQERERKETEDQNDLVVEGKLLQRLYATNLTTPVPKVIFVSEDPKLYGYEYIEGELMRGIWSSLSEDEKISICRSLGRFHAEIGKNFTKEMCEASGIDMNSSLEPHPQVGKDYKMLIADPNVPVEFSNLVKEAKKIYDGTTDKAVFQFIHNDAHHENVIVRDKKISGIIDFGDSEYGETAKEFSRYIRDYPDYFQYIVLAYEEISGNKLSYERLVSNALVSGFIDIVQNYWKGGEDRVRAEEAMATYRRLIHKK